MLLKQDRLTIKSPLQTNLYRTPYLPQDRIGQRVYRSYLNFLRAEFNAVANGIQFKAFDYTLTHWVTNQGDDILIEPNKGQDLNSNSNASKKKVKVAAHTKSHAESWKSKRDSDLDWSEMAGVADQRTTLFEDGRLTKVVTGKRKINPIIYNGIKLCRARVIAMFFVESDNHLPFVAVHDGDTNNLNAKNLYWTDKNLFPELNHSFEAEEIAHDVVIHSPSVRVLQENLNIYGWDKMFTKVTVPIPNDLIMFFKQWKISIQSAVFTSLRYISQWSFTTYSVEYKEGKQVFVGYAPALDGIYIDQIYKVAKEVPWLNELMFREGHGVLKVRYLNMSQTRVEAFDSCQRFMNDYNNLGWQLMNTDFYLPTMERQLQVSLKNSELEKINSYLMNEHGVDLQGYLNATVKKIKKKVIL